MRRVGEPILFPLFLFLSALAAIVAIPFAGHIWQMIQRALGAL